jgi:hypothetical protein
MDKKEPDIKVKSTRPVKLKDRPGRHFMAYNLKALFGFVPETIIISKPTRGSNNWFILSAVLTDEEIAKEDKRVKMEKLVKKVKEKQK